MFNGSLYNFDERKGSQDEHRGIAKKKYNVASVATGTSAFALVNNAGEGSHFYYISRERPLQLNPLSHRADYRYRLFLDLCEKGEEYDYY